MAKPDEHEKEWRRRWRDDCRILQLIPAPPGWWALYAKPADDVEIANPNRPTIHDFAWIEPIPFFALIEEVQRLDLLSGENLDEWEPTQITDAAEWGWPHT